MNWSRSRRGCKWARNRWRGGSNKRRRAIRRYAELVSAGHGNEPDRLALLESHRAAVIAKLAELQHNLELIDHKIGVYRGRLAAGSADRPSA